MPAPYNLTLLGNVTDPVGFMQAINTQLLDGYLGVGLLLGIGAIAWIAFYTTTDDPIASFASSGAIMFVMAFFFLILEILKPYWLVVPLVVWAVAIAFTWKKG
jgi:hypothetical protein